MNNPVFISICVPAYKRADYLQRLLDSIAGQTFRHFEVVVTDDSPDNSVKDLCDAYAAQFELRYFRNNSALGTPENWNEAIRKAVGQWIKLMHDDDWFSGTGDLEAFAAAARANPQCAFFFSGYSNVYATTGSVQKMTLKWFWKQALLKNPNILIADNVVGPPSVTMHRNDGSIWYDSRMKYVVDIDFYIRRLQHARACYIPDSLVRVGINSDQVTKYTFGVANVHLKESLLLLQKTGPGQLRNMLVFDGWWRLMRNFSITGTGDIHATGYEGPVPEVLVGMIAFQKRIPRAVLRKGVFSKLLMAVCYLKMLPALKRAGAASIP